jgi:hypothetical protein
VASEMERQEQFEELYLPRAWGTELCLTIIGLTQVKSPMSVRMRVTALHLIGEVGGVTMLQAVVSSAAELVLGRSPDKTSRVEVMNELTANFRRLEELCSRLEGSGVRICDLLLGRPPGRARWADHLDKAAGWLEVQ